jgi:hypothetical protein
MSASACSIINRWTPLCRECRDLGWIPADGRGSKKCKCRMRARLEQIPPLYEGLRLETMTPDLKRHPQQGMILETVKNNPDACFLICGRPGTGKTTIMHALQSRAILLDRPAVAISFIKLVEDYKRAELARPEDPYVPVLPPTSLETREARWLIGLDDFDSCEPTQFILKKIFWLLDVIRSFRHQLVVISQSNRNGLERHWVKAGRLGPGIVERTVKLDGLIYLEMF